MNKVTGIALQVVLNSLQGRRCYVYTNGVGKRAIGREVERILRTLTPPPEALSKQNESLVQRVRSRGTSSLKL